MRACAARWSSAPPPLIQQVRRGRGRPSPWLIDLLKRKPPKLAAVALANKTARIAWKLMVSGERILRPGEPADRMRLARRVAAITQA